MPYVKAPGYKKHLVGIHQPTYTRDAGGNNTPDYPDTATDLVWAAIKTLTSTESVQAGRMQSESKMQFTIWYYPTLNTKDRLKFGDRDFKIVGINNVDELNVSHIITAVEVKF